MMIMITGGSGSGKSSYAEDCITKISKNCKKYYIATMQVFDEEGKQRIEHHKNMRSGKNFKTIEQPCNVENAIEKMDIKDPSKRTVLLECMSNLLVNEMFSDETIQDRHMIMDKIIDGIRQLKNEVRHLVIVTNNVFEDGTVYDDATMEYIKILGCINERLSEIADQVIEVVVGIPVILKEGM